MQKSLFKKYLLVVSLVSLGILIILGVAIMTFTTNFWIKEKQITLFSEARSVAKQIDENKGRNVGQIIDTFCGSPGREMFIADSKGIVVVSGNRFVYEKSVIDANNFRNFLDEEKSFMSDLDGYLPIKFLGVTVPVYTADRNASYVIFNLISTDEMWNFSKDLLQIFFFLGLAVMVLLFAVAYFMTAKMVRPLRDMAEAARRMSRGDFTSYIKVDRQDELGELAVAFNNMTRSLALSEQQRKGFVANVSHELKTPMTTISGFIDGIIDGTIPKEEQSHYLEIVSNETKRLSRIVVSMLNLSKLESGEISPKYSNIDISDMILNIMVGFEQNIEAKSIDVRGLDDLEPVYVYADKDLMHQVIYNLVDNAIKYTPENGYIDVKGKSDGKNSEFSIKNSGRGIPEKDLPFIFDRFYKVDKSHGADRTGTGLGLYLVKTIIDIHSGQITVKSVENEYCEFTVVMPNYENKGETSNGTKRKK